MTLHPLPVDRPARVERMRLIRNRCAAGFANFNDLITAEQQAKWWKANKANLRAWLYLDDYSNVVGFGLLTRHDDGTLWTTVGVDPQHNGRNWGKFITHHLIGQAPGRVYGAARKDNPAAVRLHVDEDWTECDGPDDRLVYFRTRKADRWPPEGATEQWAEAGWVTA